VAEGDLEADTVMLGEGETVLVNEVEAEEEEVIEGEAVREAGRENDLDGLTD